MGQYIEEGKIEEKNQEQEMDEIERYIYNWIFAGSGTVNLADALKTLPENKNANEKFIYKRNRRRSCRMRGGVSMRQKRA